MKEFNPVEYTNMVRTFQKNDDLTGWFDSIYSDADGDYTAVFWADLKPNPYLLDWLKENIKEDSKKRAIVIGCGVGDDAEAIESFGYEVIAFDIAPTAIELCKNRYKETKVKYLVEDLFDYPKEWFESFDLVYECNTIQVLPGKYRRKALKSMVSFLDKNGVILVSCRSRNKGEQEEVIPLPLDKEEIDAFCRVGLRELGFLAYDDDQEPSVPHFFGVYARNAG